MDRLCQLSDVKGCPYGTFQGFPNGGECHLWGMVATTYNIGTRTTDMMVVVWGGWMSSLIPQ